MKTRIYENKTETYRGFNRHMMPFIKSDSRILDVGCGTGKLGGVLQTEKNCQVYGMDISTTAIAEAKHHLYHATAVDIEEETPPFPDRYFDVIVLGDIIEHLRFPESVFKKLLPLLKPKGVFVVSVPNVANILIRLKLLAGKWQYTETGILDETHVKFYTRKTMLELFDKAGLKIIDLTWIPGRYFIKKSKRKTPTKLEILASRLWPCLFATQFIFKLEPR